MTMLTLMPIELTETQSIFSLTHDGKTFYIVGDQEIIGVDPQEVPIEVFHRVNEIVDNPVTDNIEQAREFAKQRDEDRADWD